MIQRRKVLVFGATGQQGGAVVRALESDDHQIMGVTRNTESEQSKFLMDRGIEMVNGNFHNHDELVRIMSDVDTVFALTTPFEEGVEKEIEQGVSLAMAAKEAGVSHFIFNSVASADKNTGIPHFDSKYEVEKKIIELGLPYTIIAPVYFMSNMFSPWVMEDLKEGKITMALPPEIALQQIAPEDIAEVVRHVVNDPERYMNKRYDIAGDELTGEQMVKTLSRITGYHFTYNGFSPDFYRNENPDMALMFDWFINTGYSVDIQWLHGEFPGLEMMDFETYSEGADWGFLNHSHLHAETA